MVPYFKYSNLIKMKYIQLIVILVLVAGCNQGGDNSDWNGEFENLPEHADIVDYTDTPGLSRVTVMFGSNIEKQGDYYKGKRNGVWTEYDANGRAKSITSYVNGKKQGASFEFDNQGRVTSIAYHHNDVKDGIFVKYNQGQIIESSTYAAGILHGQSIKYYDRGVVKEETSYQNGQIHGTARWFDQDGNLKYEYEYDNGNLISQGNNQ